MNEAEKEPARAEDQERELEALLALSQRSRLRLERLHEVLTTPGHYGVGATPAAVAYRENKLRLLRLLDDKGQPRSGPAVLFVPAPVSRYFIIDLLPGRSFAGYVAAAGFDGIEIFEIDFLASPISAHRRARIASATWPITSTVWYVVACESCRR